jgi:hypothetical protein
MLCFDCVDTNGDRRLYVSINPTILIERTGAVLANGLNILRTRRIAPISAADSAGMLIWNRLLMNGILQMKQQ